MARHKPRDKFVKYLGDDTLSSDSALIASGIALMEAAEICKTTKDADGLIRIANAWFDMAKMMLDVIEEEEKLKAPFGFGLAEDIDGIESEPDQGESRIEIRKESRKLRKRTR